jgi:8-oxo-dGTP pyrophosphatase MutT (NUDIX family)
VRLVTEEREVNPDGTISCGVFVPLPFDLARQFPNKDHEDDSVPHITMLYIGDVSPTDYARVVKAVTRVARHWTPFTMDLLHYSEFHNPKGQLIPHMKPTARGLTTSTLAGRGAHASRLGLLHQDVKQAVERLGVAVAHTYGPEADPNRPDWLNFKAHATLDYLPGDASYDGPRPTGSWRVTELECWGHEKYRIPLGAKVADQPAMSLGDRLAEATLYDRITWSVKRRAAKELKGRDTGTFYMPKKGDHSRMISALKTISQGKKSAERAGEMNSMLKDGIEAALKLLGAGIEADGNSLTEDKAKFVAQLVGTAASKTAGKKLKVARVDDLGTKGVDFLFKEGGLLKLRIKSSSKIIAKLQRQPKVYSRWLGVGRDGRTALADMKPEKRGQREDQEGSLYDRITENAALRTAAKAYIADVDRRNRRAAAADRRAQAKWEKERREKAEKKAKAKAYKAKKKERAKAVKSAGRRSDADIDADHATSKAAAEKHHKEADAHEERAKASSKKIAKEQDRLVDAGLIKKDSWGQTAPTDKGRGHADVDALHKSYDGHNGIVATREAARKKARDHEGHARRHDYEKKTGRKWDHDEHPSGDGHEVDLKRTHRQLKDAEHPDHEHVAKVVAKGECTKDKGMMVFGKCIFKKKGKKESTEGSLFDRLIEERPERSGAVAVSLVKTKDKLPGGKGDKLKPEDVDQDELKRGIDVEMEHTKDRSIAMEIALDHLAEDPKYYTKLAKIHQEDECLVHVSIDDLVELRDSCLDCVRKHLSQALVAMQEALQGYPEHRWLAIGHLGEASDEALQKYPALANEIREHRIKYMDDPGHVVPVMKLIAKASALTECYKAEATDFPSKHPSPASPSNRTGVGTAPPEEDPDDALKIVQDGPDDDEEPDIPIKIVAQTEDEVLLERKPTKKELASGVRPDDVTWKEWIAAGGSFQAGSSSKPKSKKPKKSKPKSSKPKKPSKSKSKSKSKPESDKPDWWTSLTKDMPTFDVVDDPVTNYFGSSKPSKPKPKLSPEQKKVRDMAASLGRISRIAAGGIVFKTFEGPDFWDLPVLVSKVHPKWGNYWVFPKGGLDLGEHIYKGAAREVEEESGVKAKVINPLAFKHTSKLSESGKYDLPLVLSLLKKKFPQDAKFIDKHAEDFKYERFSFDNKSHYFIMKHTGGKPRQQPGKDEEMAKSDWFPLRKAIKMGDRQRRVVKFLLPVLYKLWKPTGGATKGKSVKMPSRPAPKSSSSSSSLYKPGSYKKSGGSSGMGTYLSLF